MAMKDVDYVTRADRLVKNMMDGEYQIYKPRGKNKKLGWNMTTTQLRNLLSMINKIDNKIKMDKSNDKLSNDIVSDILYLRVRFAYEAGREDHVKILLEEGKIMEKLENIGNSKEKFENFMKFMEAIVAFHRFYGGSD